MSGETIQRASTHAFGDVGVGFRQVRQPVQSFQQLSSNEFTQRFIAEASLAGLRSKSCIFDGEAVVCDTTALRPSSARCCE